MNTRISTVAATAMLLASMSIQAASDGTMPAKAQSQAMPASGAIAKGEGPGKTPVPHSGAATRSDVKAEAKQAVDAGTVRKGEGSPPIRKTTDGSTTRAEVKAEAAAAVKNDDMAKGPNVPKSGGVANSKP